MPRETRPSTAIKGRLLPVRGRLPAAVVSWAVAPVPVPEVSAVDVLGVMRGGPRVVDESIGPVGGVGWLAAAGAEAGSARGGPRVVDVSTEPLGGGGAGWPVRS